MITPIIVHSVVIVTGFPDMVYIGSSNEALLFMKKVTTIVIANNILFKINTGSVITQLYIIQRNEGIRLVISINMTNPEFIPNKMSNAFINISPSSSANISIFHIIPSKLFISHDMFSAIDTNHIFVMTIKTRNVFSIFFSIKFVKASSRHIKIVI